MPHERKYGGGRAASGLINVLRRIVRAYDVRQQRRAANRFARVVPKTQPAIREIWADFRRTDYGDFKVFVMHDGDRMNLDEELELRQLFAQVTYRREWMGDLTVWPLGRGLLEPTGERIFVKEGAA